MISQTAEYALRAVVFLTSQKGEPMSRTRIAEATRVPVDYLHKVLQELDRAGIVRAQRGPGGGYKLHRTEGETTLLEIVRAVTEIPRIRQCPLGLPGHEKLCPLHHVLDSAWETVENYLASMTVADLLPSKSLVNACQFPVTPDVIRLASR